MVNITDLSDQRLSWDLELISRWFHFPSCFKMPPPTPVLTLLIKTHDPVNTRWAIHRNKFVVFREWAECPCKKVEPCTRDLILSALFKDRIEIPKANVLKLLTGYKLRSDYYSLLEGKAAATENVPKWLHSQKNRLFITQFMYLHLTKIKVYNFKIQILHQVGKPSVFTAAKGVV